MIILTSDQVTYLYGLLAVDFAKDQTQLGGFTDAYSALAADLTTVVGETAVPVDGVDPAVWLWISGAAQVNADQGAFANVIRSYTATQYQLRYGNALDPGTLNAASNGIGAAFFTDALGTPGNFDQQGNLVSLPTIQQIGGFDAGAIAAGVFGGDYAPWAGTFLFADLGVGDFFTNWVLTPNAVSGFTSGVGTYNLISVAASIQQMSLNIWQALISGLDGEIANVSQWTGLLSAQTLPQLTTATNNFFAQMYGVPAGYIDVGDDIFSSLAPLGLEAHASYQIGLVSAYTLLTVVDNNGMPHVVVLGPYGGSITDNAKAGIVDGGMNSQGQVTVTYNDSNIQHALTLDNQGYFGWRLIDTKTLGGNTATEYLFNINEFDLGNQNDTLTLIDSNFDLSIPSLTIDFGGDQGGIGNLLDATAITRNLQVVVDTPGFILSEKGGGPLEITLKNLETIELGSGANTVDVHGIPTSGNGTAGPPTDPRIDLGAKGATSGDVVDFSGYSGNVYLSSAPPNPGTSGTGTSGTGTSGAVEVYRDRGFTQDTGLGFTNFNTLILGDGDNDVDLHTQDDPYLTLLQVGNGNNEITSDIVNLTVNLGTGLNLIDHVAPGTIINESSGGQDDVVVSNDILITGSTPTDDIFSPGHILLRGATGEIGSEDQWIVGPDGTKYGLNQDGDLVIQDLLGDDTYVANYVGGPNVSYADQTDGIFVGLHAVYAERLLDLTRPYMDNIQTMFKLGNEILYTKSGRTFFNADPLVFDLNGEGINLSTMTDASPMLDMQGTGFAVHSGWVDPNDGVLVLEQSGADGTPNITEMLGGPGAEGFAALAQYDSNSDGVIDANDPIYSQLRIWVDYNGNGVVDPGELETLQQAGIASISLTSTAQTNDSNAGNTITATGSFTRSDGSTGDIADVTFNIDTFHSQYLGDTTVSAAAAAMPNLKGYGTLTDLQVAMTLDPSLIDVVNANLPNLDTVDLPSLRAAALPIFVAWAEAVELPDANGNLQVIDPAAGNTDVALLISTDADTNTTVDDYAYLYTDSSGNSYWKLASGAPVVDQNNVAIPQPTFADVLAQPTSDGATWIDFSAADIGFVSRFYGQPFDLDSLVTDGTTSMSAMTDLINGAFTALNLAAVRLAMQGPLAQYFPGIVYNVSTDSFTATTQAQLAPMYEAIFAAAPSDPTGATTWLSDWLPIINIVLGDFARANNIEVTYGYQFASMVHAFEQSNLPLDIEAVATALGVPAGEVIEGGSTVTGPNQASIYYLHGGDQTVIGGQGLNNFVMGGTFGNDTIIDDEPAVTGADDPSILRFTDVASTDVTATRQGLNLILSVNGTDEQVTVENEFNGVELSFNGANFADWWGVQQIEFSDGVLWDMPDIAREVSRPDPTDATVLGTPGMDVLDGGVGGNNTLSGGDGSDIYLFGLGYGHDTIDVNRSDPFNGDTDYVKFGAGIALSDLTFSRQGDSDDLLITVNGTGDSLTILGQFAAGYSLFGPLWLDRIECFAFVDGSTYSWDQIIQLMDGQQSPAMYGFDYDDTLNPGAGVHFLSGENGNDTYIFDFGYAFDTVLDNTNNPLGGMTNTIQFGSDVTEQDVAFSMAGNSRNLVITLGDGSTMLVESEFALQSGLDDFDLITNFDFADGTVLTYDQILAQIITQEESAFMSVVYGSDYADTFDTGPSGGYHYLSGGDAGNGVDSYVFGHGYGHETVDVNWTNLLRRNGEVISFTADVTESEVQWSALGQDLVIKLAGSNDSLTVLDQFAPWFDEDGVTSFAFADGATYSLADLANLAFNGSGGGATLNISNELNLRQGPAVFQAGPGDVFYGQGAVPFTTAGNTFDFDAGDGRDVIIDPEANGIADAISFGSSITEGMVNVTLLGTNMVLTFTGNNDRIAWMDNGGWTPNGYVFDAIGSVSFADGTIWSTADLIAQANVAPTLAVTQHSSNFEVDYNITSGYAVTYLPYEQQGTTTTLRISGLDPDDVDIQRVGFPEADGNAGATAILISAADSTSGGLLVEGPQYSTDLQFDQIVFDDGTVWTKAQVEQMLIDQASASTGNTEIDGFAGNDTLYAGTGDDVLAGGTGNDTYVYKSGDGFAQIVVNKPAGSGYVDTLDFADIASTAVTLLRWPGNGINNLVISINGQNGAPQGQVTIENQFAYGENQADAAINEFVFADGVTWTEQDIEVQLIAQEEAQTSPNIAIYGFGGSDTLSAVAGISTLIGGAGADTYIWNAGDGATWISDQGSVDYYHNETDTLLIQGIDPSTVTVTRDPTPGSGNLVLTMPGQSPIILEGQTATASNSVIEQVVFDDGTTWNYVQLLIQADGGIATAASGTTARSFAGAAANSAMTGTSSDDVYFWGAGDGNDTIVEGNYDPWQKADTLSLVGLDPGDVTLNIVENGNRDLLITDKATGETLTVVGQFSSASDDGSDNWPGSGTGVELIQFADGTLWDAEQILDNSAYIAAPGATTLSNEDLSNGSIPMQASPGVQILYGRQHIDNTYIWSPGDGSDTIYYGGYGGVDTLRLTNVAEADIALIRSGGTLIVSDTVSGESITIPFLFPDQTTDGIGQIVFDDGTVWNSAYINANAEIYAGTGDNTIYGPSDPVMFNLLAAGNDYVYGGGHGDTFLDGPNSGHDTIDETGAGGAINTLRLEGISAAAVTIGRWGNDLYVERLDSGAMILVRNQFSSQGNQGVEQIAFDDGTIWNLATIDAAGPLSFTWIGTASNTTLTGSSFGNNVFDLGPGGDTVNFGSGSNTIAFDKGDGQVRVNLDGTSGTVQMAADIADNDVYLQIDNAGDLFIKLFDSSDSITIDNDLVQHFWGVASQIGAIAFADGTTVTLGQPNYGQGQPMTFTWIGTASDTTLSGNNYGNNVFDLGPGGDTVNFSSNYGNTIAFDKGDGRVQVNLDGGSGAVSMGADIAASDVILQADNNGDLTIVLRDDSADSITIAGDLHQNWWGVSSSVQQINFADGSTLQVAQLGYGQGRPPTFTWIGTPSDTVLTGSDWGSNIFDLASGGDSVTFGNTNDGGTGNNTVLFDKGDGRVQVNINGGMGILQLAADIADDDVIFQADNSGDLTVALRDDSGDSITFANDFRSNWWGYSSALQQMAFADGTTLTVGQTGYGQGQPLAFTWIGTATDTTLTGSSYGSNVFDLGPGGDTVTFSNSGANTLVFVKGDGQVQVHPNGASGVLQLGSDIADDDVIFQADNSGDLTIAFKDDSSDSITIANDLQQQWWGISSLLQQIDFADGTTFTVGQTGYGQGVPLAFTFIATGDGETLTGGSYGNNIFELGYSNDVAIGGSGADTLMSSGQSNTLIGGSGNDVLISTGTGDTLIAGSGSDSLIGNGTDDTLIGNGNRSTLDGSGGTGAIAVYTQDYATVDLGGGTAMIDGRWWQSDTLVGMTAASVAGFYDTIFGGSGGDTLTATGQYDALIGGSGPDTLIASGSGDRLTAGSGGGSTLLSTGSGNSLVAGSGTDVLISRGQNDTLFGTAGGDTLDGSGGTGAVAAYSIDNVSVDLAAGAATVAGSGLSDTLIGITTALVSGSNDTILGDGAGDTLIASGSGDTLIGGDGSDLLSSNGEFNSLLGGTGAQTLTTSGYEDTLIAGTGVQTLTTSGYYTTLIGGGSGDLLSSSGGENTLIGGAGAETLTTSGYGDTLIAGSGGSTLTSDGGQNMLIAGSNADILTTSGDQDTLYGTAGGDTLDGSAGFGAVAAYTQDNVTVDLAAGTALVNGTSAGDTLTGFTAAEVFGTVDTIIGDGGADMLTASGSNDSLIAGGANTTLTSNAGGNWLDGSVGGVTASYNADNLTVDLTANTATVNGSGIADTLIGITTVSLSGNYGTLIGGGGDTLFASSYGDYNDTLISAAGANTLITQGYGDTLIGGSGLDSLLSEGSSNTLIAGTGANILATGGDSDLLIGGSGATTLIAAGYFNTLNAGGGANTLTATGGYNTLTGGAGDGLLSSSGFYNTLTAGSGTTTLTTSGFGDTLVGGSGNDTLIATASDDTLIGGSGTSTLVGDAGGNLLIGGSGVTIASYALDDVDVGLAAGTAVLNGTSSGDDLSGISDAVVSGNNDTLSGDSGFDTLRAAGAGDTLVAGSGYDILYSNAEGNTLDGSAGAGVVAAYAIGNVTVNLVTDTAAVNGASVADVLLDIGDAWVSGNHDTVIGADGVTVLASGTADTLFAGSGIETLGANGTNDTLYGNAGGDILLGVAGTVVEYAVNNLVVDLTADTATVNGVGDTLVGISAVKVLGTGDTILGGAGSETLSSSGSGNTLIAGAGVDTLASSGTGDVLESNASGNVLKSTGTLTVASYALNDVTVDLATGTAIVNGASAGDTLTGIKRAVVSGADDTLIAGSGSEVLTAAGSADTLVGGSGPDTLVSNLGGNLLQAGTGVAVASYAANGLTVDLATGTATVNGGGAGDALVGITRVVATGNDDTLITDGTTDTMTAIGNSDTLIGGAVVSTLSASGSGDTLFGGSAATTLISNAGGNTLEAGTGRAIASYSGSGLTVNLATATAGFNGGGVSDTLVGIIDAVVNGNDDTLIADGGSDTLSATGNGNTLIGGSGTATLTATGSGNTLLGGSGTATLISNAGGNTLTAGSGLTVAQYAVVNVSVDLAAGTAAIDGAATFDTLIGIVDAAVTGTGATVTADGGADTLTAKGKNDTLFGGSGADTLTATGSGDLLLGGAGTTTLVSNGNGNTLQAGSGQTVAVYTLSNLTVDLGAGSASHGATSDMLVGITDVTVTGASDVLIAGAAAELLSASGSTDTLTASSAGGDTLQVTSGGNDTLVAKPGGNVLIGDSNHTTAVYAGNDLTIDLATGTATDNLSGVSDSLSGIGSVVVEGSDDTVIADGGNDTLSSIGGDDTLIGGSGTTTLVGSAGGDTLEAGSGKTIASYAAASVAVDLGAGTAVVNGAASGDTLVGIDTVVADGHGDTLTAGAGNDTLTASGSGDTLIAGNGNDRLTDSGSGGVYEFARGDGNTTLVNGAAANSGPSNTLDFGAGIADDQLWFVQSGNNLQIDLMGTKTRVTVSGWFSSAGKDLQEVGAGGLEIDSQVSQLVQAMATYSAANPGFNPTSPTNTQAPNDPTLQAAIAAAWHH